MTILEAVVLGILQGLTEFLPVSSSGHLVIAQKLLGFSEPPIIFDVLLHIGSLMAVLVFFNKQFLKIKLKIIWLIIIGTFPAVLVGLFLNKYIDFIFNSWSMVGYSFIITAVFLFSTVLIKQANKKNLTTINWLDSLIIGFMQAVAILPGISRSGSTVVAGLWRKLSRETAFMYSFYLAVPAILGASVLKIKDVLEGGNNYLSLNIIIIGLLTSGLSSLLAIFLLKKVILKGKLNYFGVYCLILGLTILFFKNFF